MLRALSILPLLFAMSAAAQGQVPEWLRGELAALGGDDLAARDAAMRRLATDPDCSLTGLEACLVGPDRPGAEVAERLLRLAKRRFMETPRAAMGVQFSRFDAGVGGVEINGTVRGFESEAVLRPGDVIRSIGGMPTASQAAARCAIVSREPGERVTLDILRRGEALQVTLAMGSFAELSNAIGLDGSTLEAAWNVRCKRLGTRGAETAVATGLDTARWVELQHEELRRREEATTPKGKPQEFVATPAEPFEVVPGGGVRLAASPQADPDFFLKETPQMAAMADQLRAQISVYRQQISQLERQRRAPNLPAFQKRNLDAQIENLKMLIERTRDQIKRLPVAGP
ncbi:MAG: PDZ domain-containing protein [Leptolyngbya sp. PLA1]|nr:PDZ domain-containing protein [Leptolyngbya sp. PLA1]